MKFLFVVVNPSVGPLFLETQSFIPMDLLNGYHNHWSIDCSSLSCLLETSPGISRDLWVCPAAPSKTQSGGGQWVKREMLPSKAVGNLLNASPLSKWAAKGWRDVSKRDTKPARKMWQPRLIQLHTAKQNKLYIDRVGAVFSVLLSGVSVSMLKKDTCSVFPPLDSPLDQRI